MSDDTTNRGRPDRDFINLEQDYEVQEWTQEFGVSEEKLREAVQAVGNSAEKVREHLAAHST